jgi:tetratricopeptide (TPR) repeat protein
LLTLNRIEDALETGLEAVRRFPENVVARTGLGEVLRQGGRLEESESVYRETVSLFPENVVARTGLETVLAEIRRVETTPEDDVQFDQVPSVKSDEAQGPQSWGEGRKGPAVSKTPFQISERAQVEEPGLRSKDIEILLQDSYLLRRWARATGWTAAQGAGSLRSEAGDLLRRLSLVRTRDARAAGELGLLELQSGELGAALDLLRASAKRFPGSARVRYALARAEREAAARRGHLDPERPEAPALPWRRLIRLDAAATLRPAR